MHTIKMLHFKKEGFVQYDLYKQQKEYSFLYNRLKRSRNFLFVISMMMVAGLALFIFSFFFHIDTSITKLIIFADLFIIIIISLYWYLQVQPINVSFMSERENFKTNEVQENFESINEIEAALLIYDTSSLDEQNNEVAINELIDYISDRTYIFPYNSGFHEIDSSILTQQTRRKLFGISLQTLKTRLLEKKEKEDENAKNKSAEESDKDKSLDRMIQLVDIATTRLKTEIAQLSKRANIYT